jgi:SAM-dependent methyltransferase
MARHLLPFRLRPVDRLFERGKRMRALRLQVAELVGEDVVLEVGCGRGRNAAACADGYLGIDVDAEAIADAQRDVPHRRFLVWDLVAQGPVPGEFDTLLLSMTVHELGVAERVLEEVLSVPRRRVLVVDYDPALGGWLRLREGALEMGKLGRFGRLDLVGIHQRRGWRLHGTAPFADMFRWWEFRVDDEAAADYR